MNRLFVRSVLALAIATPLAAQEHDLRLTATPGSSVWFVQSTTQSQEIDMGQVMESKNVMDITAHVTVKEASQEGVVVEFVIARVSGLFDVPMMGEFKFDSIDKQAGEAKATEEEEEDLGGMGMPDFDRIGSAATGLANTKLIATLNAYGKVQSIDGVEKALEAMNKRAGKMGSQVLAGSFSEHSFKSLIESAFGMRPEKPIAIGGSWDQTQANEGGPGTASKIKFTLAKVSDKAFEVTGTGTIEKPEPKATKADEDESAQAAMIREMQANMKIAKGTVTGKSVVSREDGFVVETSTNMSMDLSMQTQLGDMSIKARTQIVTRRTTKDAAMQGKQSGKPRDGADK